MLFLVRNCLILICLLCNIKNVVKILLHFTDVTLFYHEYYIFGNYFYHSIKTSLNTPPTPIPPTPLRERNLLIPISICLYKKHRILQ
jgi:hypothetical protein